jgi:hypothetical protein
MMTAMSSLAAASGTRSWLARQKATWLTERQRRGITIGLFAAALIVAGTMSGSS